ncbi:MAG: DUF2974 domain-containing protein [Lachnospira sp.]|nr:DUF2974 domain-containing protein [Lachnospira sp.]
MALSNYQLILLDNLIYLNKIIKINKSNSENNNGNTSPESYVRDLITDLLDNKQIYDYWKDDLKEDQSIKNPGMCLMRLIEWKAVLTAIQNDETLMNMKISNVYDSDSSANPDQPSQGSNFRAACFSNDEETVIVFRGTHGAYTWNDNGEGGYQATTRSQQEALNYVNLLGANLTTSGKITVTGHSKGGNLAQYVTICAANLVVDRCVSFDGQGFSNEIIDTPFLQPMRY